MALDYSTLHLTWQQPHSTVISGQPDCTFLRLIRNTHNLSQDEDDGMYLWGNNTTTPTYSDFVQRTASFTDSKLGGGFHYYTMWGWSQSEGIWVRCSDLIALVPLNWGYGFQLYNRLPMAYRDADVVLVDPYNPWPVDSPRPPLQRYLSLLGFQMDFIRTELESLTSVMDAMNCSGALLPLLAQELGLTNEPAIGMQQERTLVQNAIHLYKLKGSPRGISEFASVLTSYPMATLTHHGYNLLLSRDSSVAETSVGSWQTWPPPVTNFPPPSPPNATGVTVTRIPNLLAASPPATNPVSEGPGLGPYPGGLPGNLIPPYNNTGMSINASGAGDRWITTGRIPITDFMSSSYGPGYITWKIQIWSSVARQVKLSVWGDVGSGTPVSIIPETTFTETAGHWTIMTVTAAINPYPNGPTQQAAYYFVLPVIHIVGAIPTDSHYVTLMGIWPCTPGDIGINTPVYDYPRDVKITLSPQNANLLTNTLTNFMYGFDGLSPAVDPTQSSTNFTCGLTIHYVSYEDPPGSTVNGAGYLQVATTNPGATVWFGISNSFTQPLPTQPLGWFSSPATTWPPSGDAGDWFPNEVMTAQAANWFDPVMGWFFESPFFGTSTLVNMVATSSMGVNSAPAPPPTTDLYFTQGTPVPQGNWFPVATQPPLNGNLAPFTVPANQPFNFSVYADYLSVVDPSNAVMQMGFRWYYPDGTWQEISTQYVLTNTLTRYSIPPDVSLGFPPNEPYTGIQPTTMYPFVRFPYAQSSLFGLNSAMLSPGVTLTPYFDSTMFPGNHDYVEDSHGGSYYYRQRSPRTLRLESVLYKWIPMGASHTEIFGAGGALTPLDPTMWTHPAMAFIGNSGLTATAS
jgi:phage tail-like protein